MLPNENPLPDTVNSYSENAGPADTAQTAQSGEIPQYEAVKGAIDAHLASIKADEATFTEDGKPIDVLASERTGWAEREAFVSFVRSPCASAEEANAKLRHMLDGSVAERNEHLNCLLDYGDSLLEEFLRSLLVLEPASGPGATREGL